MRIYRGCCCRVQTTGPNGSGIAWEGDTVFEQWRDVNFPGIQKQLGEIGASLVLAQFGQMEVLKGPEKVGEFVAAYEKLLGQVESEGRRVVLVSPVPFGRGIAKGQVDLSLRNDDVRVYVEAIRALAERKNLVFVDVFTPLRGKDVTEDGIHLSEAGHRLVAAEIGRQLGAGDKAPDKDSPVRLAALELERLWFNYWRPMNWAFLEGDRVSVPFSRDWKDGKKRLFSEEMQEFRGILEEAEANVGRAIAAAVKPVEARSPVVMEPPTMRPESPEEELATWR